MKKYQIFILTIVFLILIKNPVSAQLADSPWPMFRQNAQHTGQTSFKGPEIPTLKWEFKKDNSMFGFCFFDSTQIACVKFSIWYVGMQASIKKMPGLQGEAAKNLPSTCVGLAEPGLT